MPLQGVSRRGILRKGISVVVSSSVVVVSTVVEVDVDEAVEEADVVDCSPEVEFDFEPENLRFLELGDSGLPVDESLPSVLSLTVSGATPEMIAETPKYTATPIPPPIISTRIVEARVEYCWLYLVRK